MTEKQEGITEALSPEEKLNRASDDLGDALLASGRVFSSVELYGLGRRLHLHAKDALTTERIMWEAACLRSPEYASLINRAQAVMAAGSRLITEMIDPISFLSGLSENFGAVMQYPDRRILTIIGLVRKFVTSDPAQQEQMRITRGGMSWVYGADQNLVGTMKQELGDSYYEGTAAAFGRSILTGGLQLPAQDKVAEVLAK